MALREIVVVPHDALARKAEQVTDIDDRICALAWDMIDTMYRGAGIGLAANQVGELRRIVVVDVTYPYGEPGERVKNPIVILNPEIRLKEGECVLEEGCLSVPEMRVEIMRPECVQVTGIDLDGNPVTLDADGILARALQHEIDHLDGSTILDHASVLKRNIYKRRIKKRSGKDR